jgi:hypothetical protein
MRKARTHVPDGSETNNERTRGYPHSRCEIRPQPMKLAWPGSSISAVIGAIGDGRIQTPDIAESGVLVMMVSPSPDDAKHLALPAQSTKTPRGC